MIGVLTGEKSGSGNCGCCLVATLIVIGVVIAIDVPVVTVGDVVVAVLCVKVVSP
jgi:hypothetical protein